MSSYSNGLFASPAEINADGVSLVNFADNLAAELASFDSHVAALMEIWHGDSSKAFNGVYADEKTQLENFKNMLHEKGDALQKAATVLSDTEAENTSAASKLGN